MPIVSLRQVILSFGSFLHAGFRGHPKLTSPTIQYVVLKKAPTDYSAVETRGIIISMQANGLKLHKQPPRSQGMDGMQCNMNFSFFFFYSLFPPSTKISSVEPPED